MLLFSSDGPARPKGNGGSWSGPLDKSEWPPPDPRPQPGPDPGPPPPPNPQPPSPPMGQGALQDARDVNRLAPAASLNLLAATRPVGDDEHVLAGRAYRRKQRALRHRIRDVDVLRLVSEASRHPAATRFDRRRLKIRDQCERSHHRRHRAKRLLVAMSVNERVLLRQRLQRQVEPARIGFTRQELFEQRRARGERPRRLAGNEREKLVTQGQQTRRLDADDRDASACRPLERGDRPAHLAERVVDEAHREIRSAATQRAAAIGRLGKSDDVARGFQYPERSTRVLGFEPAAERVDEEDHLRRAERGRRAFTLVVERRGAWHRDFSTRAKTRDRLP